MSYILDALRRADAERERGAVPGLHAQPLRHGPAGAGEAPSAPAAPWWWLGLAALVAAGGLGALWLWRTPAVVPAPAAVTAAAPPVGLAVPAVPVAPPAAPALPAPAPAALPPWPAASPAPAPAPARVPSAAESDVRPRPRAVDAAIAPAPTRLPTARELPDELKRDLPALAVNGASYSETPANRLLIINGQVFHEGDKIGPEHVLEQIRLKSAVLRYRGTRYLLEY